MANILVEHNQADNDAQLLSNLIPQALGYSDESRAVGFKNIDPVLGAVIEFSPSQVGIGSNGTRVSQAAHGLTTGDVIRYDTATRAWVRADPATGSWATHYVFRVHTGGVFDCANAGSYKLPSYVAGLYGILYASATGHLSAAPETGAAQVVGLADGTRIHLAVENKLNINSGARAANLSIAMPVPQDDISVVYANSQGAITSIKGFLSGPGTGSVSVALYVSTNRSSGVSGTAILTAPTQITSLTSAQVLPATLPVSIPAGSFVYAIVTGVTGSPTFLNLVVTYTGID